MDTLKSITDRLAAARSAFVDANANWEAKKAEGGDAVVAAQQLFNRTRRECEAAQFEFSGVLTDLKRRNLLRLSIDLLDGQTLLTFRRLIATLKLDAVTEPISYASFEDTAMAWFDARIMRDAALQFSRIERECETAAEFDAQLEELTAEDEEERYTNAIERYRFLLDVLTQPPENVDDTWRTAVEKLFNRARAELDELDDVLRGQIRRMGEGFRRALLNLPEDVSLLLRRTLDGTWMPEPQRQPEPKRTAVATLTSEAEESAEEVGLTPEAERQVDELLRSLEDKPGE